MTLSNPDIIRVLHDALNRGDFAQAVLTYAEDTRNHGVPVGRAGVLNVYSDIYTTFPDFRMDIQDLAAVNDDVIVRCTVSGTHTGVGKIAVLGGLLVGVQPTGKTFKVQHIHWYTLKDGLVIEHRANRDDVGRMRDLGLLPAIARTELPKP